MQPLSLACLHLSSKPVSENTITVTYFYELQKPHKKKDKSEIYVKNFTDVL